MSSEKSTPDDRDESARQVSDELLRKASEGPVRHLPDALFGAPAPARPADAAAGDDAPVAEAGHDGVVSDDLLRTASEGPVRHLPDLLFGGSAPQPAVPEDNPGVEGFGESGAGTAPEDAGGDTGPPAVSVNSESAAVAGDPVSRGDGDVHPADSGITDSVADQDNSDGRPRNAVGPLAEGESVVSAAGAAAASAGPDSGASNDAVGTEPAAVRGFPGADDSGVAAGPSGSGRPVLLVIADSLAYFGPQGGLPSDDPRIWPNLVAAELDWDVELIARIGWTCRDAYWALIGDPRVWAAVPRAGAVVFATGGMDSLPSPLPTALRELIRYLRPPSVRRRVRDGYGWLQPRLSKLGRPVALPPQVSIDYLEQSRTSLAQLRPELPVVGVLPSVHDCEAYGRVHSGRAPAVRALRAWSAETSVPLVDLGEAVRENVFHGESNPDGIHWGWEGHGAVARAMVKVISEVRS